MLLSLQQCTATINNYEGERKALQGAQRDMVQLFGGSAVSELRRVVDQNKRNFKKLPIGPIGAHLNLTDTKWAQAAEIGLGGQLDKWIVHDWQDERVSDPCSKDTSICSCLQRGTVISTSEWRSSRLVQHACLHSILRC